MMVAGSQHNSYTPDMIFVHDLAPLLIPTEAVGSIAAPRMVDIIQNYVLAFFDTYVESEASPLLTAPQPDPAYPEVALQRFKE